jgi:DDE superfamily endonuclease
VIAYRATLDVPGELVQFVAKLLAEERRRRGTPKGSRALTCFWQAVLGVRWFRDRTAPDALARDHGISRATAYRYLDEVVAVPADEAPELREALERARNEGLSHVILDGKIIPCDRCKEPAVSVKGEVIDLWYSGKAHAHGGSIQAVCAPGGFPLWVSQAEPGSVHDLTAARAHAFPALYPAAALRALHVDPRRGTGVNWHLPGNPGIRRPGWWRKTSRACQGSTEADPRQGSSEARHWTTSVVNAVITAVSRQGAQVHHAAEPQPAHPAIRIPALAGRT